MLGAAMAVITAHLGKKLFGDRVGLIAGLIVAVDLLSMSLQLALMSETVFTFLLLVCVYFLIEHLKTGERKQLVMSASAYSLAVLCRPIAQWFFLIMIGLLFFRFRSQRSKALQRSLILMAIYALAATPWIIRNYRVTGTWTLNSLTTIQLETWAAAIEGEMKGLVLGSNYQEYAERVDRMIAERQLGYSDALEFRRQIAWQVIKEHPGIAVKLPLRGFIRLFGGVTGVGIWGYSDSGTGAASVLVHGQIGEAVRRLFSQGVMRVVVLVGQYLVMFLIYAAMFYGLRRSWSLYPLRENPMVWLTLPIIYFGFISLGPNAYSRLLVPVIPFIAIMAGYGVSEYYSRRTTARVERGHRSNELSTG
jgi:4-amino-4-deoxy-L-arabinose transferase-like glycosyltransferase